MSVQRKFDVSSEDTKRQCIDAIIARINETIDEEIGIITAEDILSIVSESIGPEIYNKALSDTQTLLKNKCTDLDIEIELLKQQ